MATLTEIVTVLKAIRRGSEYYACCPAHADSKPSLSITEKHGQVHVYCHAGCSQRSVTFALEELGLWGSGGVYSADYVNRNRNRIVKPITNEHGPCVAKYDYTDENHELLYQIMRFEPGQDGAAKAFLQRRPAPWMADGWTNRLDIQPPGYPPVRPVLYHLPEVIRATQVFLVEGEKDVETLRSHENVATTGAGGARSWRSEYGDYLQGKRVIVIPDQDDSGRIWLNTIAHRLPNAEVLNLPAKDITDWFNQGHTKGELDELIN